MHMQPSNPYYASGDGLRAKHQLVRTNSGRSFPQWALSLAPITTNARVLDAGAGWGRFTWALVDDFGVDLRNILCMDQSPGMLRTAAQEAAKRGASLHLCAGEIEALPVASGCFDGVMANHVLYHLRDIPLGVRELARVARPSGWLLATTNSDRVRVPLIEIHHQALEQLGTPMARERESPFSMENGEAFLRTAFRHVERFYFEDETTYTDAHDFAATYATTGRYRNILTEHNVSDHVKRALLPTFEQLVRDIIQREGVLRVPTGMGAFVCRERN